MVCQGVLASARQYTKSAQSAQTVTLTQPAQTKHELHRLWAVTRPLWMPCVHKKPHTFGTSRCTLLPSDRLLRVVRSPFRTAYTTPNIGGISGRETVTPAPCNQRWSRTSVHNPPLSECDRVSHGAHQVSNNARLFGYTSHGSLGRVECIFSSRRPCDAPLGRAMAAVLTRRWARHIRSATS